MSYIGRQLNNLSDRVKLDSITASATATYNLLLNTVAYVPSSAESLTVSLNGVIQAPQDSYTVSGSQITFASALTSSDSIDFILAERSITLQTPSAGSVGLTQLSATGTKDATTFLRGDNTFATAGGDLSFGGDTFGEDKVIGSNDNYSLGIETNGSERIRFRNDGKIRIGGEYNNSTKGTVLISSADSGGSVDGNADELVIEGSGQSGITILSGASDKGNIFFADSGSSADGKIIYNHTERHLRFDTDGGQRLIMDRGGNFFFNCSSTPSGSVHGIAIEGDNELSISTNSTSADTVVRFFNDNGQVGKIETSGSSTSYDTSSDYRLKENINYDFDATTRVKQLKPARFNFIADADTTLDGFIAHEVTPIVPEAISGEKDAVDSEGNIDPQGIDQSKLVPLLTKALQEAITKIETLEAKVQALENA